MSAGLPTVSDSLGQSHILYPVPGVPALGSNVPDFRGFKFALMFKREKIRAGLIVTHLKQNRACNIVFTYNTHQK